MMIQRPQHNAQEKKQHDRSFIKKELNMKDLLSREIIELPNKQALLYLQNKRILITGAGGSIGSELATQLLYADVSQIYLLGHGEYSIYKITQKLYDLQKRGIGKQTHFIPVPCELTDEHSVHHMLKKLKADVVFHTAAYKHVDLVEKNPVVSTATNIFGTKFLIDAAKKYGTQRFILISTDKAANPTSVYGANKLVSEQLTLNAGTAEMRTSVMRFGNVLGSRGSVIPLFKKQIAMGGPITITSPECRRYFMTLSEACSLILYALQLNKETLHSLYALEMGKQISIMDIAQRMLDFYGLKKDKDISFTITGLRPGEKISENLLSPDEEKYESPIEHVYYVINNNKNPIVKSIDTMIKKLYPVCFYVLSKADRYKDKKTIVNILQEYIPLFKPITKTTRKI